MVRASTLGMIDFSEFDPWDLWWWRKMRWTIKELEREQTREVLTTRHNHWITLASHGRLKPESFEATKTNAQTALNQLLKATYPWLADKIGEEGTQTDRQQAIDAYHAQYGRPGEARYDAMVARLKQSLVRLSPMEKKLARKKREQRWKARRQRPEPQGV